MKLILAMVCCGLSISIVRAQEFFNDNKNVVSNRKNSMFLYVRENVLKYSVNNYSPVHTKDVTDNMVVHAVPSQVNLYADPLNPLVMGLTINTKAVDDQEYLLVQETFEDLKEYLTVFQTKGEHKAADPSSTLTMLGKDASSDKELFEALLRINGRVKFNFAKVITDELKKLLEINYAADNAASVLSGVKDIMSQLKTDEEAFGKDLDFITTYFKGTDNNSQMYNLGMNVVAASFRPLATQRVALANKMNEVLTGLEAYNNKLILTDSGKKVYPLQTVQLPAGKSSEITITLEKVSITIGDQVTESKSKVATKTFVIERYKFLSPKVVPTLVYADVSLPQFGTGTDSLGRQVVVQAEADNLFRFTPAIMLNLNYNIPNSFVTSVFFQIGTGPSKDYPVLLNGLGVSLFNRLYFGGGFVEYLTDQLDSNLKLNDPVDGTATIESHLIRKINARPYASFGFSF